MIKKICFILLFICGSMAAIGQTAAKAIVQDSLLKDEDYLLMRLPPLSEFLDAATNYSEVKYFEAKRDEERLQMRSVQKEWLGYLRLQANYQYGTNNSYFTQVGDQIQPGGVTTANVQNWYNAGAALSIPLNNIFDRRQKVGMAKKRIEQIDYEAERALENRQLIILETYNEVLKHLAILKVKAEAVALYNAQMQISENDFINGNIDIISLSLERARRSEAIVTYQESRASLHNAVTLLEMLTDIKIIKK